MEARFIDGTSVNRVYGSETATELLAVFQYESDAKTFAKSKLDEDASRDWFDSKYVIANSCDGTITILKPEKPKADVRAA